MISISEIYLLQYPTYRSPKIQQVTLHILVTAEDEFGKFARVVSHPETFPIGMNARLPVHLETWIATAAGQRRSLELNKENFLKHFAQQVGL